MQEHAQLTVLDAPGGAGVLPLHTGGAGALLQESGFVDHEYSVTVAEVFDGVGAHVIADPVNVPGDCPEFS
jgi:hypothetical protein